MTRSMSNDPDGVWAMPQAAPALAFGRAAARLAGFAASIRIAVALSVFCVAWFAAHFISGAAQ